MKAYQMEMRHMRSTGERRIYTVVASKPVVACRKALRAARKEVRGPWDIRVMAELPELVM